MTFDTRERNHVANCPRCDSSHRYTELKFPMINDRGGWLVACRNCSHRFVIHLRNPIESHSDQCVIIERFDDEIDPYNGNADGPGASVIYQLDMNVDESRFELDRFAIYRCATSDDDLEKAAFIALHDAWNAIANQHGNAMQFILARSRLPTVEHAVIVVDVDCSCEETHQAIFYHPLRLDGSELPRLEDLLLADVSGADLSDVLTGILTKTEVMDALEKLIIRWRLFSDQILLATPFVAHQWKSKAERLTVWERLLSRLDPTRATLVTRSATYTEYKKALIDAGLDHDMLARFGLENRIVGDGKRKQDSHAKFYMGLGEACEVLSGSANVVEGNSSENVTFQMLNREKVDRSYIARFGITLPKPQPRLSHHLLFECSGGSWRGDFKTGVAPQINCSR